MAPYLSLGNFYGVDSFIDFLILLVAALVAYQSHRIYRFLGDKNYKYFSWAFLSIAVSHIFKIIANLTIIHQTVIKNPNFVLVILSELSEMQIINFLGDIFYKTFTILGFLLLFLIVRKIRREGDAFLFAYLCIIAVLFSIYFDRVFHLTLIFMIFALTFYFYQNFQRKQTRNSFLVFLAFVIIFASHLWDIFYVACGACYISSEIILLLGFLILLLNQLTLKNEQKKK